MNHQAHAHAAIDEALARPRPTANLLDAIQAGAPKPGNDAQRAELTIRPPAVVDNGNMGMGPDAPPAQSGAAGLRFGAEIGQAPTGWWYVKCGKFYLNPPGAVAGLPTPWNIGYASWRLYDDALAALNAAPPPPGWVEPLPPEELLRRADAMTHPDPWDSGSAQDCTELNGGNSTALSVVAAPLPIEPVGASPTPPFSDCTDRAGRAAEREIGRQAAEDGPPYVHVSIPNTLIDGYAKAYAKYKNSTTPDHENPDYWTACGFLDACRCLYRDYEVGVLIAEGETRADARKAAP